MQMRHLCVRLRERAIVTLCGLMLDAHVHGGPARAKKNETTSKYPPNFSAATPNDQRGLWWHCWLVVGGRRVAPTPHPARSCGAEQHI